ncbi:MAG: ATP-binding protein [Acholeplasma sp.]|nr:ATP-binding protein [Acholeplasma sp.]
MLDEIRKRIMADKETKKLKIEDTDLLKVNRYLDIRDQIIDGYKAVLKTEPYIEIVYLPTEEKRQELLRNKLKKHLLTFDSDIYLQDAKLEDFQIANEDRKRAFEFATSFLNNYQKNHYEKGLYVYGKYASGKTYLLSAIANELASREINVLLVFMPDLVRNIKQGITDGDMDEKINILKQADVLMLDDLGGENMTAWFRDEILLPIIQYRLSAKLPLFISSNLSMEELAEMFAIGKGNELDYVKSVRIIQRIRELTHYVKINDQYKKISK